MKLDDRKIKILEAIITDYIATAEPIGSRTIAKKYDLGVSPATIRNEMSDLEELGFIEQPHTSAGRIPSQKGYRLYVDNLMHKRKLTTQEIEYLRSAISFNVSRIEYLMQQTAKALSMLTSYTTIVTEPTSSSIRVKHIQLVPIDEKAIVAVLITDDNAVHNEIIRLKEVPNGAVLYKISDAINALIKRQDKSDIKNEASLLDAFPEHQELIAKVVKTIVSTASKAKEVHVYTSGVRNILGFPEFNDIEKAKNIFQALEEKDLLITLLGDNNSDTAEKIQILIGDENSMEQLQDCSIVRAGYKAGNNAYGRIGVIGPTRMNYSQTVSVLGEIVNKIDAVLASITDYDDGGYE